MNKADGYKNKNYYGLYLDAKGGVGTPGVPSITVGDKNPAVKADGKQAKKRKIEVRGADKGAASSAVKDIFDEATQGAMVKLQKEGEKELYMSVVSGNKASGNMYGYASESEDWASHYAGQGDQTKIKKVNVGSKGKDVWTASVIPPKKLKRSFGDAVELFAPSEDNPELLKSIVANNMNNSPYAHSLIGQSDAHLQPEYDFLHATIAVLHKSWKVESIFQQMQEMSESNVYLAKSMADTGMQKDYVEQFAGTLGDPNAEGTTQYLVEKAKKHHA